MADALGVTPDDVEVLHGDTSVSTWGLDSYGSRSLSVGGVTIQKAAERVREKARVLAAHELEVAEDDLEWIDGKFQVRGAPDRAKTIPELAFSSWAAHNLPEGVDPVLEGSAAFDPPNWTFPSGTHICVVEVDPETGSTRIDKYVAVDDCGTIINPMIVDGQVMGGVAQGIAEALYEEALYDENGTLLTGNMMTYRIPSAAELPGYTLDKTVTPSSTNPHGGQGHRRDRHHRRPAGGAERGRRRAALRRGRVHRQAGLGREGLAGRPGGAGPGAGRARRPRAAAPARPV